MRVREVMTRSPQCCSVDQSANDAARIMWERDCGAVPVIDGAGIVVGMVTDRDICIGAYFHGASLGDIPLTDIMSREVCACEEDADLNEAERAMRDSQVRRLPITDRTGRLVGILSLSDVAQLVARTGSLRPAGRDGQELLETVTVVSQPRRQNETRM